MSDRWLTVGLIGGLMLVGLVGRQDYRDQQAVEEFRRDYVTVVDATGEPVVMRKGVGTPVGGEEVGDAAKSSVRDVPVSPGLCAKK